MDNNKKDLHEDEKNNESADKPVKKDMPGSFTIRKEREELIKKGIEFPRTSELTYIDDKGNVVEI